MPVADTRYTRGGSVDGSPKAEDSIIPELGKLATKHGSRVIFLRPPMAPRTPPHELVDATLQPDTDFEVADLLEADGHLLVDMHRFPMQDSQFTNFGHMNDDGAALFTKAFAAVVKLAQQPPKRPTWDLFGQVVLDQGQFYLDTVDAEYTKEPTDVPRSERKFETEQNRAIGTFSVPDLAYLEANTFKDKVRWGARCSPLRVQEDGELLGRSNENCKTLSKHPKARTCHAAGNLRFGSSDGAPISEHIYRMALDPERACMGGYWMYPKDKFSAAIHPEVLAHFPKGINSLEITAFNPKPDQIAELTIRLLVDGERLAVGKAKLDGSKPQHIHMKFDRPIRPGDTDVTLRIVNSERGFAVVTAGVLSHTGRRTQD
jgi:hypothetical protein